MITFFCSSFVFGRKIGHLRALFALRLSLGGKLDICGRDDLLFCSSLYPALLAWLQNPPLPLFQISGHAPEFVVAVKTLDFVSGVFVIYLEFFEGMIWGFTKNIGGSTEFNAFFHFLMNSDFVKAVTYAATKSFFDFGEAMYR